LLDDFDIISAVKAWVNHEDKVLAFLCKSLINRNLFKIKLQDEVLNETKIQELKEKLAKNLDLSMEDVDFLVITNKITSYLYNPKLATIKILEKSGAVLDFAEASDQWSSIAIQKAVTKYYCCYPKL
jgi:hypothetical protein